MANIMVNEACNLRCPYCFAEEFVNKSPKEMSLDDFRLALDFALSDETDLQVGIIGGEPLIYSHINEAMHIAIDDIRTFLVMIYTNAVELERLEPEILDSPKFRLLVNCNSPEDMGEKAFEKMRQNLLRFKYEHRGDGRVRLSVNIYKPDFDYSYVIPLVKELEIGVIRLSVSVPQRGDLKGMSPMDYFLSLKPVALKFIVDMIHCGAITGFDCNFIPDCLFTDEERESLMSAKEVIRNGMSKTYSDSFWERAIFCELNNCSPVVDILPDLQAIRCFGLSEHTKRDIRDFRNIDELGMHYIATVDRPACGVWTENECEFCTKREYGICSCGCLIFKMNNKNFASPSPNS